MKPAQKILLGCRQTGETAARLSDWLDANPHLLATAGSAVRDDLDALAGRLTSIARATETPPGIGVVGSAGAAKTDLVFQLVAPRAPASLGELGQRPLDAATLRGLLPDDADDGGLVVVRYSSSELPPAPRGFPVRVGLLSMADVAAIIARAASRPGRIRPAPAVRADVADLFASVSGRLSPQALPGLSERDVVDLRETLNAILPGDANLAALHAARYFEQFREIAPHVTETDRRRVLAKLWHDEPAFTAVFDRLCDGLDRLGHGADAYCPSEALLGKDRSTGWMVRHPRSVIQAATLATLDRHAGAVIAVMNRYGQAVDIERAVLAALIAELPLHLGASRLDELAPAELLDFPVPPPLGRYRPRAGPAGDAPGFAVEIERYARAKTLYLFERACLRRDVTSLIVVANAGVEDDSWGPAVGDWVETAQGPTAHARERVRRGLFVAAARGSTGLAARGRDDAGARLATVITDVLGEQQDWTAVWTPGRPVSEVVWFSRTDAATATSTTTTALSQLQDSSSSMTALAPSAAADDAVGALAQSLAQTSDVRTRHHHLNLALLDIRRQLRSTVMRHHVSSDPAALADWRRGTAVVVQNRLQLIVEQRRLGHLVRALLPDEDGLIAAIDAADALSRDARASANAAVTPWPRGRDAVTLGERVPPVTPSASAMAGPERIARLAEAALAHWFKSLRLLARSGRQCRELNLERSLLHTLIDELQIGAIRLALSGEIATAFLRSAAPLALLRDQPSPSAQAEPPVAAGQTARLAAYAYRIITAYVEVLSAPGGRNRTSPTRLTRDTGRELEVADAPGGSYASSRRRGPGAARRTVRPAHDEWDVSFLQLVEENIAAAHLLSGRGDKDRELGELVALFAPGPFEVEP